MPSIQPLQEPMKSKFMRVPSDFPGREGGTNSDKSFLHEPKWSLPYQVSQAHYARGGNLLATIARQPLDRFAILRINLVG